MTKGRLTRQELSWLLAQEAQNAADRLRSGVQILRSQAGSGDGASDPLAEAKQDPSLHVDASLDTLDDVMKMLANLNQRASSLPAPPRRGRIDLAALVLEVAPDARVSIQPGSGTEVFGDEGDFRRMIQVLVGHASGEGSSATVRREGDEVRVAVTLGPDSSPTAETERSWLGRMALRYGGRHELEGGTERVAFPADDDNRERAELLRELDEARRQGEVYARELRAVTEREEGDVGASSLPPADAQGRGHLPTLTRVCGSIAVGVRAALEPLLGALEASSDLAVRERVREHVARARDMASTLERLGGLEPAELELEVDLAASARAIAAELAERSADGARVVVDEARAPIYVRAQGRVVDELLRELLRTAVERTPRAATVEVAVVVEGEGARLVVVDKGPHVSHDAQRAALGLARPVESLGDEAPSLVVAAELAASQGAVLTLSDAPGAGLRASVLFPKRL